MPRLLPLLLCSACAGLSAYAPEDDPTDEPWWTDTGDTGDTADTGDTDDTADTGDTGGSDGPLIITEVVDHSQLADIKYVEIYNPGPEPVRLSGWTVECFANGGTTGRTATLPDELLTPGEVFVVANAGDGEALFQDWYDRPADAYSGAITGNGNDAYALQRNGVTVDLYGQVGVDGLGAPWDYTDSVARRARSVNAPTSTWQRGQWEIFSGHLQSTPFLR